MKLNRKLLALATLAPVVLIAAAVALTVHTSGAGAPAAETPSAGSGPFLTASAIPQGLANRPVPRFDLADARGGTLSTAALRGRPYALTFLYVHCVNVCPLIGSEIQQALAELHSQARAMNVVAVSVDPRGDTREAVLRWLSLHREPSNFHYLIGSERKLAPIWKAFYVSPQIPGDPQSSHTAIIWLINRRGRLAALVPAGLPIPVGNLAHDLRVLIDQD